MTSTFTITPQGSFDLAASAFAIGPSTPYASELTPDGGLILAFPTDDGFRPAAVYITQPSPDEVAVEVHGEVDVDIVRNQVARMLSLDVDGREYDVLLARDPVLTQLAERYGPAREVLFPTPYEAGAWPVIATRVRRQQGLNVKQRMAEDLGTWFEVGDVEIPAFPGPDVLITLGGFRGLFGRKVEYLHALGFAALEGDLDPDVLGAMERPAMIKHLKQTKGIGDWAATVMLRGGLGAPDLFRSWDSRLREAVGIAYGEQHLSDSAYADIADSWLPYRSWVAVLFHRLADDLQREGRLSG